MFEAIVSTGLKNISPGLSFISNFCKDEAGISWTIQVEIFSVFHL